jgi:putative restriction endonuclease
MRDTPAVRVSDEDDELRAAAFAFLRELSDRTGGIVTRQDLRKFVYKGEPISLEQHMRGIRHLARYPAALSLLTTFSEHPEDRPYEDDVGEDGYPRYKWQRASATAADNVAVREAMRLAKPVAWFRGVAPRLYEAIFPVWIVDEEPALEQFVLALDEAMSASWQSDIFLSPPDLIRRREYALRMVRVRLLQPEFRRLVLNAYEQQCSLCRLRHPELLDAAHIREDSQGGAAIVTNGIAMCAIHHRAFDSQVLGIRPDHVIEVRSDVREERDGPTLQHALQGVHGQTLVLPRRAEAWPDPTFLEERYTRFRQTA